MTFAGVNLDRFRPAWLEDYQEYVEGELRYKETGAGRYAAIIPFLFTTAIIRGMLDNPIGYDDRWCYETKEAAEKAFEAWDGNGEPDGWHRHPSTGRRRPGGDAAREYMSP